MRFPSIVNRTPSPAPLIVCAAVLLSCGTQSGDTHPVEGVRLLRPSVSKHTYKGSFPIRGTAAVQLAIGTADSVDIGALMLFRECVLQLTPPDGAPPQDMARYNDHIAPTWRVRRPAPGLWTAHVRTPQSQATAVTLWTVEYGGATSDFDLEPAVVGPGGNVVARLVLAWNNRPVLNADVGMTSSSRATGSDHETTIARDDGQAPDSLRNDGIYTTLLHAPILGDYDVEAWATVKLADGRHVNRRARGGFLVARRPNLAVFKDDVVLTPVAGDSVLDISVQIRNIGGDTADSVRVDFDDGNVRKTFMLYSLHPGDARPLAARWRRLRPSDPFNFGVFLNRGSSTMDMDHRNNKVIFRYPSWPPSQ